MIPQSLLDVCKEQPSAEQIAAMRPVWKAYRTTKKVPDTKEEKLILGSILNLSRAEYKEVTGLQPFQSMYLTVNDIPTPKGVEAHKALRDSIPTPLELVLLYPSISIALYAEVALTSNSLLDTKKYTQYIESIGKSLSYRKSTGLINSAAEETNCEFFDIAINLLGTENFSKRFFLQGKVLFAEAKPQTKYDIVCPLNLTSDTSLTTSLTTSLRDVSDVVSNDMTDPIAPLFSRSDVTTLDEVKRVWAKLKTFKCFTYKSLANSIRDKLSDQEKIAAINLINQTRPNYTEITGHSKLASPLHILMRKPVDHITREEHIALRKLLLEEGGLTAMYLLYPSLSVAVQAQAALATGWPEGGKELAIKHKEFADHCGATYQNRLNVRFLKRNVDEPDDPFYKEMRKIVPLNATRHVYQAAVAFCKVPCTSMYDINNIVTLKGECISPWGAELPENQFITKGKYRL